LLDEGNAFSEFALPSSLPRGLQPLLGIEFDLRGIVELQGAQGKAMGWEDPEEVRGIKVGQACRRIHLLSGAEFNESEGTIIAKFVFHFADGLDSELPIRYGNDVRNYWIKVGDVPEHKDAVRAWLGTNAQTSETGISFRFYKPVWENPRPDTPVETVDFISTMSDCGPLLLAITVE
jgi:hypothetical protein